MKTAQQRRGAHEALRAGRGCGAAQVGDTWQVDRGWMVQSQMKGLDLILRALEATDRYQMENDVNKCVF